MPSSLRKPIRSAVRSRLLRDDGLTLIEVLVAMMLMVVVMMAVYTIWSGLQRTYNFTEDDMKAQQEARMALAEMVEFIRTARQPEPAPSEELDMVIVSADANSLVCWTDVDRDASHDLELVRFRVDESSRTLYRDMSQTGDATFAAADSVRLVGNWISNGSLLPLFSYSDSNGTILGLPVADPTVIRQVTIDLHIDIDTMNRPIAHQLTSVVQPRNLRQY